MRALRTARPQPLQKDRCMRSNEEMHEMNIIMYEKLLKVLAANQLGTCNASNSTPTWRGVYAQLGNF